MTKTIDLHDVLQASVDIARLTPGVNPISEMTKAVVNGFELADGVVRILFVDGSELRFNVGEKPVDPVEVADLDPFEDDGETPFCPACGQAV